MSEELKPCPTCGGEADVHYFAHDDSECTVMCSNPNFWENADLSRELHDEMLNEKRLDMALTFHEYSVELREYADRIREALGVRDD